jgi:serine/threonine-protein kinase
MFDSRYRVIGLLGRGGMGEVYRADDLRLGQPVALKFLPSDLGRDPVRLAQFHNEVRTARHVAHPNVCRVYDIGEVDGHPYITMEYVDGEDLSSLLRRIGRLPEDKAVEIARQICAGLAAAHDRGVLHRDLKPANVMLDGSGKVRIMDFSLGAVGNVTDIRAGTPAYMAPEQLAGREVSVRSDIYSLGLVLYELFTGKRAFDVKTLDELLARHRLGEITAPTTIVTAMDPSVERAIMRCLDQDPQRRPASALAVAAALPGGDPLAAALAAGETPSPEMVAAAGGEDASLTVTQGVALLVVLAVMIFGMAALQDRVSILARVPIEKSRPVLVDRAEDLKRSFGFTQPPLDAASGYTFDDDYLAWAARHGGANSQWAQLSTGVPPALHFWYRTSPSLLVPLRPDSPVTDTDPPILAAGMTRIDLDLRGRLMRFRGMPAIDHSPGPIAPVNWDPFFQAAGLDRSRFTDAPTAVMPRSDVDEWHAWEGTVPEFATAPLHVEASSYHGRATNFYVTGPWALGEATPQSKPSQVVQVIGISIVVAVPISAAFLARRHVRSGRGDTRGAFRIWAFAFAVAMASWIISPTHVNGMEEVDRLFASWGVMLLWSLTLYVVYLALEPYVRKSWPDSLITWSRLLAGRLRDPLVGRDLLVGTVVGLFVALIQPMFVLVPALFGWPQPALTHSRLDSLLGLREMVASIVGSPFNAMLNGTIILLILSRIRYALAYLAGKMSGIAARVIGSQVTMLVVSVVVFIIVIKRNDLDPIYPWLDVLATVLLLLAMLLCAIRFGLFALIVVFLITNFAADTPLTLNGARLYAGPGWFAMFLLGLVGALGFWMARQGNVTQSYGVKT